MIGKQLTIDDFINRSILVHGNKYDYSKVEYINNSTKVCIICPIHGEFWQTPHHHMRGHGCAKCGNSKRKTVEEFINDAISVHGNKYDYSKVNYINNKTKVCIICPVHGEFWQTPHEHLSCGCDKCSGTYKLSKEEFVERSICIHDNKYDYSKVNMINCETKVCIICPTHGEFWQSPSMHMSGQGCPFCKTSHMERDVYNKLKKYKFDRQVKFKDWLINKKTNRTLSLDFYNKKYNIAIECQGRQHFTSDCKFGKDFDNIIYRDILKYELCREHNIELIYYFPDDFLKYNVDFYKNKKCFHNIDKLMEYIKTIK